MLATAGCFYNFKQWVSNIEFQDILSNFHESGMSVWGHMRANLVGFHNTEQYLSLILGISVTN